MSKDTFGGGSGKRPQNRENKPSDIKGNVKKTNSSLPDKKKNRPVFSNINSAHVKNSSQKKQASKGETKNKKQSDKEYLKSLPPPKKPVNPFLVSLKRLILGAVSIVLVLAIFITIMVTVFFKVDEINVEGKTRYNVEDIVKECLINYGDSLITCNTSDGAQNIYHKFPYIEEVTINKQLFSKINITVKEAVPSFVIENSGKYVILGKSGKIVEVCDKNIYENIPMVLGAKLEEVSLSSKINYEDENMQKYIENIFECIEEYKLSDIKTIDVSDTSAVTLIKSTGFKIMLGNFEEIDYKLKTASAIMAKNVKDDAKGKLDVSLATPKTKKSYLKLGEEVSQVSKQESKQESKKESSTSSKSGTESSAEASESSETSEETSVIETTETSDDGGNDDGGYDDGGNDDGSYDDGGNDDGGYDDGGYDDGGYDDGSYDDGGYDDGGYDDGGYDDGGYDDGGNDDGGYDDGGYDDGGYDDGGYDEGGYDDGTYEE